tara:strand:+ start:47 stop:574 length:528 start_codon:yes stop_codon:yes gene_type:complete
MFGFLAAAAAGAFLGSRGSGSSRVETRIEYRDNPEQVKRIKALEDQLKISTRRSEEMQATMAGIKSEAEQYRAEADKTLAAADERLKTFRTETTAAEERRRTDIAAAEERRKIEAQVGAANRLMEGRQADLQIQSAGDTPRLSGTQQFRRRKQQFNIPTGSYQGLGKIKSGMVNV